jgi:LPXTG-motif cell wall-anchored protein
MKNTVSAAVALPTAIVIALGGLLMTAPAANAEAAPTEQVEQVEEVEQIAPTPTLPSVSPESTLPSVSPEPTAPSVSPEPALPSVSPEPTPPSASPEPTPPSEASDAAVSALAPAPASPVVGAPGTDFVSVDAAGGAVGTRVPLTVGGTGTAGALVAVSFRREERDAAAQVPLGTRVGQDGTWSVDVVLESGDWSYSATQQLVDADGVPVSEVSAPTPEQRVRMWALTAPAPSIVGPAAGTVFGAAAGATSPWGRPAARVPVSGTGTPGAVVRIGLDGTELIDYDGGQRVRADGSWSATVSVPIGTYRLFAVQDYLDEAVYVSRSSPSAVGEEFTVTESAVLPAPVVTTPTAGAVFDTPASETAGYLTVTAEGTGVPGAVVIPFIGTAAELEEFRARNARGELLPYDGPIVVDASGRWRISGFSLPGDYLFTAVQYDSESSVPVISAEAPVVEFAVRAPVALPTIVPVVNDTAILPSAARPADRDTLAHTGSDSTGDAALAGLALLGLGTAAALVGRRRRA